MIRKLLKASTVAAIGLIASSGLAQNLSSDVSSPISFDLIMGVHSPDMDIRLQDIEGADAVTTEFIPEAKSGINVGLRGNFSVWKNVSVYGQLGYSNNNTEDFSGIQSFIDPLLGLLSLGDGIIDPESIRVDIVQDGNFNLFSSNIGLRYDYKYKEKYNLGVYAGLGYYNLKTPGIQVDVSGDVNLLGIAINVPINNIVGLGRYTDDAIGWQLGANLTYDINNKFYAGINLEYNQANFEYSSMTIGINEEAIPDILSGVLPIDLSIIPDLPIGSDIDMSSFKYGIVLGMRL